MNLRRRPGVLGALLIAALCLCSTPASCFCSYNGKLYAKTTVAQEFADSRYVARVVVVAADDHWSDEDDSWTMYHVRVVTSFKGVPPARLDVFTYRDSGGFYLDKGLAKDLGGQYLLFLDSIPKTETVPVAARSATEVNYSCGQSKVWHAVTSSERLELKRLAKR